MKTVNSLSGGGTSSFMAVKYPADYDVFSLVCIDDTACAPKDKSIIQYVNDKLEKYTTQYGDFIATAEDDKTLYAMRDLEQFIGREIIWVRGKSFDNVIDTKNTHGGRPTRLPSKLFRYCTDEMKLLAIFMWWFYNVGEKVKMRIGFRFDEFDRMEKFFNGPSPCHFKIPISTRTYGKKLQKHESFNWRSCSFPCIKDRVVKKEVIDFWKGKIDFPSISNCVGCFWKNIETLAAMSIVHPEKMGWFRKQESKGKGTWLQNTTYDAIDIHKEDLAMELLAEIMHGESCDSGGCTA